MSHYYYFAATLPTLQLGAAPPLSSEDFLERCSRSLDERAYGALRDAALSSPASGPPAPCVGVSALLDGYYAWERSLRASLARARALRLGRPAPDAGAHPGVDEELAAAQARAAAQAASPLEGEFFVERERWAYIDSRIGFDRFSFEALAAYRLQLLILERLAGFTAERGELGYRAAYDAILGAANSIDLSGERR